MDDSWAFETAALGSGSSGYLSLSAFTGAGAFTATTDVPEPVIADPVGADPEIAAPEIAAPSTTGTAVALPSPLSELLPGPPQTEDLAPELPTLAAPADMTSTSVDPLVEMAPAAFVLSASLGGLVLARRRSA